MKALSWTSHGRILEHADYLQRSRLQLVEKLKLVEELKEKLEMMKLHEMLADPHPEEEAISKV